MTAVVEVQFIAAAVRSKRGGRGRAAPARHHGLAAAAFAPRAVAVVGASRDPASIGGRIIDALIAAGFAGPIHPVNPHATPIHGRPVAPRPHVIYPPAWTSPLSPSQPARCSASSTIARPPA